MDRSIPSTTETGLPRPRVSLDWVVVLASLPILGLLIAPLVALVLRVSPSSLPSELVDPQVAQAIGLSLTTTAVTTLLTVLAGTPAAYLLARRRMPGHRVLDTLVELPMVLPPSVAGIALLVTFGRQGLLGHYLHAVGIDLAFTPVAVVLAQTFVSAPFYIRAASNGLASVDPELERAAALDGASESQVFRHVTLPLAFTAMLGGAVMTWARALGEFGATIIFAGNFPGRTQTMPLAIYMGFQLDLRVALTLAVVLLVTSFAVLFLIKWALRQRVERLSWR